MNIKKIIQEEMNSFDWAEETPSATELVTPQNVKKGMRVKITDDVSQYTDNSSVSQYDHTDDIDLFLRQSGGGEGVIHSFYSNEWVTVQWDDGSFHLYPIGHNGNNALTMINDSIQEEMNSFDWTDEVEGIHIGMCFSRTNTSAKYKVISVTDGVVVTNTGVAQARRFGAWDEVDLLEYLSNGTLTICQDPKVT